MTWLAAVAMNAVGFGLILWSLAMLGRVRRLSREAHLFLAERAFSVGMAAQAAGDGESERLCSDLAAMHEQMAKSWRAGR